MRSNNVIHDRVMGQRLRKVVEVATDLFRQLQLCNLCSRVHTNFGSKYLCETENIVIQYASIKSLRSTIVERSFYGASVCVSFKTKRCENGNGTEQSQERNGAKTVCKTVINYARKLSNALDREIGKEPGLKHDLI